MRRAAAVVLVVVAGAAAAEATNPFRRCVDAVERAPDAADSYYCFVQVAQETARHAEAARHLERYVRERPEAGRIRLDLAIVAGALGREDAEALYARAIEDLVASGDDRGAAFALSALAGRRIEAGAFVEAEELLDRATGHALAAGDPLLAATTRGRRAQLAHALGDYGRARRELLAIHDAVEPDGPLFLRLQRWSGLGAVRWALGEPEAALRAFERQLELARGRVAEEPAARYNVALVLAHLRDLGRRTDAEVEAALRAALAAALAAGDRAMEAQVRLMLAQDLRGASALAELSELAESARARGDLDVELLALRLRAEVVAEEGDLPRALEQLDAALGRAREVGSPFHVARAQVLRAGLLYSAGGDWVDAYETALDAVERIRGLQPEAPTGDAAASSWSYVHRRYAAKLLDAGDVPRAFLAMERLRGATARERLWAGTDSAARVTERRPVERRLTEVLGEIARVQRRAGAGGGADADLAALEREEIRLRDLLARLGPAPEPVEPASLDALQRALQPDRALIAFQSSPYRDARFWPELPRDWAVVVTANDAWAYPLPGTGPGRAARIEVYRGLLANRDGSEVAAAARLGRELLAGALDRLPDAVDRLVVVPDGALASLPLETLRSAPDAPPLGLRRAVTYAPSATSWLRTRGRAPRPLPASALAFADPFDAGGTDGPGNENGIGNGNGDGNGDGDDAAERDAPREPLPWARVEGRDVVAALSGRLLEGADATERALKRADLARVGLIHFGAHALVSEAAPRRTAVALAPGGPDEDGLLQLSEIVELPLDGQIVILAACRSADGKRVDGAGVVGLADAFLRAGASAVIGTLWPVLDEETSRMTVELARRLAEGAAVEEAARAARRRLDRAGRPAGSWGGIVVLGDGEARLAPTRSGASPTARSTALRLAALAAALALVGAVLVAVARVARGAREDRGSRRGPA